jgi:hypothetical protein
MVSSTGLSLALGAISLTLMLVYYGPIVAIAHQLVPANMRALTSAVLMLILNLFGLGLGPLATGYLSDILTTHFGMAADSLRYAISFAVLFSFLGGWMFWRASNLLPGELLREAGDLSPDIPMKGGVAEVGQANIV